MKSIHPSLYLTRFLLFLDGGKKGSTQTWGEHATQFKQLNLIQYIFLPSHQVAGVLSLSLWLLVLAML